MAFSCFKVCNTNYRCVRNRRMQCMELFWIVNGQVLIAAQPLHHLRATLARTGPLQVLLLTLFR